MHRKLYIHIPFCVRKCNYCDFNSYGNMLSMQDDYTSAVINEIKSLSKCTIDTIYLGGGTPSYIKAENIAKILNAVYEHFEVCKNAEITIEANPATLDDEKLSVYKSVGISRISLGAQSFVDEELKILGRVHTAQDIVDTYNAISSHGFSNVSLDLMFGIPKQTMDSFIYSIDKLIYLNPEHISCYALNVEEGTPFHNDFESGKYSYTDDDTFANMYDILRKKLSQSGYIHYEISNFAKENYHSRHNSAYWKCDEYYGVGAGASSYINGERYTHLADLNGYINDFSVRENIDILSKKDKMSEFVILGLRLLKGGIDMRVFKEKFGVDIYDVFGDALNKHISTGFIEKRGERLVLAEKSYYISNGILVDFM